MHLFLCFFILHGNVHRGAAGIGIDKYYKKNTFALPPPLLPTYGKSAPICNIPYWVMALVKVDWNFKHLVNECQWASQQDLSRPDPHIQETKENTESSHQMFIM